jgi:hypothetical protein
VDLKLILRVVGRFKNLVLTGFTLGLALAVLSYVRVDVSHGKPSFNYRSHEEWGSVTRLLVTTPGFTVGSANPVTSDVESRLPSLATVYASFVTSDDVRRLMLQRGRIRGVVDAIALPAGPNSSAVLPIVSISALAFTPHDALALGNNASLALTKYVDLQQQRNGVPKNQRIQLRVLNRAGTLKLIQPRSKTLPIVVLLAVMFATVALAFALENANPRVRALPDLEPVGLDQQRRATS